uniref:Nucleolar protein 56 n=1 Tax=Phallusia mammillata TaxID=59560 RepID=A0A6F9DLT8_9ASCI|nr:nucleolar protein 56-like [Phallusia mammillata]
MATQLYVLYEHASGYALFSVKEVEDIGALLPTVERAITDFSLFVTTVKLVSFSPFKSSTNALDNMNSVSEGILHDDLKVFLDNNVPKSDKANVILGIGDPRISATIQDEFGLKCSNSDAVIEILRGLRVHFPNMVKGLTMQGEAKAQLGLGHSYSRAKVKFNVNRADNMIIQSIALLDQLDKDINTFSMRVKEWYSYHFPELVKISSDNYMYCRLAKLIGNRKTSPEDLEEKIEEITMDSAKAKAIIAASKMSMGMDVSPIDLINIESFCSRVISLTDYRKSLVEYLHARMQSVAPNLSTLIGDVVGARLISHAGSLTSLAKYPASTVQILGAEKALFRALKQRGNTPKYGLIFHSTFIGRAGSKNKGRISRYLANKCSIASRIDCFTEFPNNIFGEKLKDQVEERLKFYESGEAPRKNADVMKEAVIEANSYIESQMKDAEITEKKEKKKKKKKRKSEADASVISQIASDDDEPSAKIAKVDASVTDTPKSAKKKKNKNKAASEDVSTTDISMLSPETKKKKKKQKNVETVDSDVVVLDEAQPPKKKKKSKKVDADTTQELDVSVVSEDKPKKKKKKEKDLNTTATDENVSLVADDSLVTPKKKKKNKPDLDMSGDVPKSGKKKKKILDASQTHENGVEEMEVNVSLTKSKKKKKKVSQGV